jgi:hypothetical protein
VQPGLDPDVALDLDWSAQFDPYCPEEKWQEQLLPALDDVVNAIYRHLPGRPWLADGQLTLPAALALGQAFSATSGLSLSWLQRRGGGEPTVWSLASPKEDVPIRATIDQREVEGDELALLVSITQDVRPAFEIGAKHITRLRAVIDARLERFSDEMTAGQAVAATREIVALLQRSRALYSAYGTVHVMIAGPVGLAVLLAQKLNTFSEVATYDFITTRRPPYAPAAMLRERTSSGAATS